MELFFAGLAAIAPVCIAIVAAWYTHQARRREKRQALANIHRELTTGEVAVARDVIGVALYAQSPRNHLDDASLIRAYFQLYWCVERVDNLAQIHAKPDSPKRVQKKISRDERKPFSRRKSEPWRWQWETQKSEFLTWNLDEIVGNIIRFRHGFAEMLNIDDDDAWASFVHRLQTQQYLLFLKHKNELVTAEADVDSDTQAEALINAS